MSCPTSVSQEHKTESAVGTGSPDLNVYGIMQTLCQVPDLKPTEHLWDVVDQEINIDSANINVNMDQYLKGTLVACGIDAMKA